MSDQHEDDRTAITTPGGPGPTNFVTDVHTDKSVTQTKSGQPSAKQPADDLVLTPGGYRSKSLVHSVAPGNVLDYSGVKVRILKGDTGELVQELEAIPGRPPGKFLMPDNVFVPEERVPGLQQGWIVSAAWTNPSTSPITSFRTKWTVPPPPLTDSGQLIFLFNGVQNSTMIYQPVLQWGSSADGGSSFWAVASWYADGQGGPAFKTDLEAVKSGDVVTGVITLTGASPWPAGDAAFLGSILGISPPISLAKPVVGIAATRSGKGYWLVAADGGIFTFGDAGFFNSIPGLKPPISLNAPVVGMAVTPSEKGYWLVAADGGIFTFGDAGFFNSIPGLKPPISLAKPVVGMAATPSGKGYWLAAADGGVFTFGDAQFFGSLPKLKPPLSPSLPVVGMAAVPTGKGYFVAAGDDSVFSFGTV